jgi:membrane protease YdiL (CAAX protease family)
MAANRVEIGALGMAVVTVAAVEFAMHLVMMSRAVPSMVVLGAGRILQILLFYWIARALPGGANSIGLAKDRLKPGFKLGAIWSLALAALALIGIGVFHLMGQNPLRFLAVNLPVDKTTLILYIVVGGLAAPAAEELFFRGYVFGFFRRYGLWAAVAISTIIFALAHMILMPAGAIPFNQLVGGVVFALAYERSQSLIAPIIIHTSGNLALFGLSLISNNIEI